MNLEERLKYAEMKARHENILRPWYKKWWGFIILTILGLVLIVLIVSSVYIVHKFQTIRNGQNSNLRANSVQNYLQRINGNDQDYFLGTTSPQVTIVEFGDFLCPHCKKAYPVVNELAQLHKNKIKIIWRDYLINSDSIDLALAARCAGEQGKFWSMHDSLLEHQSELKNNNSSRPGKLITLAKNLNLNIPQFTSCLSTEKYLNQIKKDYADGNALKIPGTPTWFVNNHTFSGYVPLDKFNTLITGLIK